MKELFFVLISLLSIVSCLFSQEYSCSLFIISPGDGQVDIMMANFQINSGQDGGGDLHQKSLH